MYFRKELLLRGITFQKVWYIETFDMRRIYQILFYTIIGEGQVVLPAIPEGEQGIEAGAESHFENGDLCTLYWFDKVFETGMYEYMIAFSQSTVCRVVLDLQFGMDHRG